MTSLVGSLHMNKHEVVFLQGVDSSLRLTLVVGVGQSGGTRYLDDAQTSIFADALNEIDSRDDGSRFHLRVLLHQRLHRGTIATAPRPDAVGLAFASGSFRQIVGMLGKELLGTQDEVVDEGGGLCRGEMMGVSDGIADHTFGLH